MTTKPLPEQPVERGLLAPPIVEGAAGERARTLHNVSLALIAGPLLLIAIDMLAGLAEGWAWFGAMLIFLAAGLAGQFLLRGGRAAGVARGTAALVGLLAAGYVVLLGLTLTGDGISGLMDLSILVWFGILSVVASMFLGRRGLVAMAVLGLVGLALALSLGDWTTVRVSPIDLPIIAVEITLFGYLLNLALRTTAETRERARAAEDELARTRLALEKQIEDRAQALALAAAVGRQITRIQNMDTLLNDAVRLIRDRFELYHVQVYLLNPTSRQLILHAATGAAGAELLRRNHRLPVGPGSINGAAAAAREVIAVPHARQSPMFLPNPLLPETQSELAAPILYEDAVIGTLNLQSSVPDGLGTESVEAFTVLAAQLATAIENSRLFSEITQTREQAARQSEAQTQKGWSRFVAGRPIAQQASAADETYIRQPITVRGATIGYLKTEPSLVDSPRARELVAAVAEQLGAHLENLRLTQQAGQALHEARQREEEMALLNRIVTSLAASTDLQTSLQIVVDQLAQATSIQQVGIAILNETRTGLTVLADRSGQLNTDSAVGFVIPVENNPATQMALTERRPIVVPNATENPLTESAHDVLRQRGVKTILILPLVVENEAIGTVGLDVVEEGLELTDDQLRLAETIVYQAASTIQRAQLFNETEEARQDAERLFAFSAALNAARDADDIVAAIVASGLVESPSLVTLSAVEVDEAGQPRWSTIAAQWTAAPGSSTPEYRPGERFHVPDIDIIGAWSEAGEPLIIEDVTRDERVDGMLSALYGRIGARATALLPLRVRDGWVGLVELLWREPRGFNSHDRRILRSMATQLAVTLSNQQLVEQVRGRSRQLESLSRVEAALSLATTEDEILAALAGGQFWGETPDLQLSYLTAADDGALMVEVVSRIRGGALEPLPQAPTPLDSQPLSALWLDQPRQLLVIESAKRDIRLSSAMRAQLREHGHQSAVLMPLRRGGQWQGLLVAGWPESHILTADEAFILQRLHEPLAATVAGRRAYLAQQTALASTEAALVAQARLSAELQAVADVSVAAAASLNADRLLAAAADLTREHFRLYHTHIYLLDEDKTRLILRAGAGEIGRQMVREGRQIAIGAQSIVARAAREREIVLVPDTRDSTDFLPHPLLPNTRSELAVPLTIGDRLLGILDVQSDEVGYFTADDRKVYRILAAQLAVATQNAFYFEEQFEMAEKLREVDRLKTDFLARMSHELRTPLNSIIGFADVLLMGIDGELTERMVEDLQLISSSGYHLRDIIGGILDMSKIEAGRLELAFEEFDVRLVASELVATAAPLAEQKGLELRLELADDIPPLTADRTRIRQVLWNIVGNAIKFTDHGRVTVVIQPDGDDVSFCVSDTGIGIPLENQTRIFDHFSQLDTGQHATPTGTGLGLSISKSLVELHGGRISVDSAPGEGSTFRFIIPLRPADWPAAGEDGLPQNGTNGRGM